MFSQIWEYISSRGLSPSYKEEETVISLYNQMSFITGFGLFLMMIASILIGLPTIYAFIILGLTSFYLGIIVLNHFKLIYTVRYIVAILTPVWVCVTHLMIAGNFSQDLIIVTTLVITYVSFSRKPKYRLTIMLLSVLAYLSTLIYTQYHGPYFGIIDSPYDNFLAFFMSCGWLGAVIYAFVKDRIRLITTLQSKNTKLRHTTEELERFTYIASHDLKSPLRTINSFIGLIERDIKRANYEALPEKLQFVKTGAKQMNSLVEDILEISILNNPNKKKKKEIDLNLVADKVCDNLREDIKAKNATLRIGKLPSYTCDEAEFSLLFQNMIQNGIKYNENPTPEIKISSQTTDSQIILSFEDNGIGIEEEYHEQIFQFFKRLHTSDKYSGTGLGLGLCKKIVNSYNGYIQVFSETGKGSVFQIILKNEARNN